MKATLAYISMVGVPLVGLFLILDAGAELRAPRSLGGDWSVTAALPADSRRCALTGGGGTGMTVVQSGGRAEVFLATTAGRLPLHALIGGGRVIARPGERVDADCRGAVLELLYSGDARVERMTGVWVACGGCPAVEVVAERAPVIGR